jgi:tRNA threonylcarbamoyladenosine biosynthesis protein TsaE
MAIGKKSAEAAHDEQVFWSSSPAGTRDIAAKLAVTCSSSTVLALRGDLGAGKTEFVKGLAEGMGCQGPVTSPTFAIAHEYSGGRLPVFHFDFYRMEDEDEFDTCGFEECLGTGVVAAEWADKFAHRLPPGTIWIELSAATPSNGDVRHRIAIGGL